MSGVRRVTSPLGARASAAPDHSQQHEYKRHADEDSGNDLPLFGIRSRPGRLTHVEGEQQQKRRGNE
jgi:hypothetical protein